MSGSKVINHDVLAQEWLYDLMARPNMRIKVGCIPHDIRILGRVLWMSGGHPFSTDRSGAETWECEARNNPYGIF